MGCLPCFESRRKRDELGGDGDRREEKRKEEQPMVPPSLDRVSSGQFAPPRFPFFPLSSLFFVFWGEISPLKLLQMLVSFFVI